MQIRLVALLTSLLLALPGIAYPSGKTSVVVFGPHGGGPQDAEFLRAISGELIAGFMESDLLPLHGAELNERLDSVRDILPERVFLSPDRDAVRSGQRLYRDAQPEEAAALLRAAVPQLEAGRRTDVELGKQQRLLEQKIPGWSQQHVQVVSDYLAQQGFSQAEIASIRDHRVVASAYEAATGGKPISKSTRKGIKIKAAGQRQQNENGAGDGSAHHGLD